MPLSADVKGEPKFREMALPKLFRCHKFFQQSTCMQGFSNVTRWISKLFCIRLYAAENLDTDKLFDLAQVPKIKEEETYSNQFRILPKHSKSKSICKVYFPAQNYYRKKSTKLKKLFLEKLRKSWKYYEFFDKISHLLKKFYICMCWSRFKWWSNMIRSRMVVLSIKTILLDFAFW